MVLSVVLFSVDLIGSNSCSCFFFGIRPPNYEGKAVPQIDNAGTVDD